MAGNPLYGGASGMGGWDAYLSMPGMLLAPMFGRTFMPAIPSAQSMQGALYARGYLRPQQLAFLSTAYGQFGSMIGNDAAGILNKFGIVNTSPEATAQALRGVIGDTFNGQFGSFVAPMADQILNNLGITGGSIIGSAQQAFARRAMLGMSGGFMNPYNVGAQSAMTANAAAYSNIVNNMIGGLVPNHNVTRGFDRETLFTLGLRMAGSGAFDRNGQSWGAQLQKAAGDFDITGLDAARGDFTAGAGGNQLLSGEMREKLQKVKDTVTQGIDEATKTLGAMRDLLGDIGGDDKLMAELDKLTNGSWARSINGARQAREQIRNVTAVAQMYDLDPRAMVQMIGSNRGVLQQAAGFNGALQAMGFDGGGMFGLGAQAELFEATEAEINRRGVRGDPIKAGRLRMQGVQSMARTQNTMAGRGSQLLAYARQTGIVSDADFDRLAAGLTSGEEGDRARSLNELLTTTFGSAERGRRMMNDSMFVNSMRQSMNADAGIRAMQMMLRGSENEWMNREVRGADRDRLAYNRDLLADSGLLETFNSGDVGRLIKSVSDVNKDAGTALQNMYDENIRRGMDPDAAWSLAISGVRGSKAFTADMSKIDAAVTSMSAGIAEERITANGREAFTATKLLNRLQAVAADSVKGKAGSLMSAIRTDAKGALADIQKIINGLPEGQKNMLLGEMREYDSEFSGRVDKMNDMRAARDIVDAAAKKGYSSSDITSGYNAAVSAISDYISATSRDGATDDDRAAARGRYADALSRLNIGGVFGDAFEKDLMRVTENPEYARELMQRLGRQSLVAKEWSTSRKAETGVGLEMDGFHGGGFSAYNSRAALDTKQAILAQIDASEGNGGELRRGFAQRVWDYITGNGDIGQIFGAYKEDDLKNILGEDLYKSITSDKTGLDSFKKDLSKAEAEYAKVRGAAMQSDPNAADGMRKALEALQRGESIDGIQLTAEQRKAVEGLNSAGKRVDDEYRRIEKSIKDSLSDKGGIAALEHTIAQNIDRYGITDKIKSTISGLSFDMASDEDKKQLLALVGGEKKVQEWARAHGKMYDRNDEYGSFQIQKEMAAELKSAAGDSAAEKGKLYYEGKAGKVQAEGTFTLKAGNWESQAIAAFTMGNSSTMG